MATKKEKKPKGILSLDKIGKKYHSALASSLALSDEQILRIPSRVLALNYQLNGGLPYGKIIEIYGPESTGKSLLAQDFAYCTIAMGGMVIWADAENAWSNTWATQNGLALDKVYILPNENAIEKISDWGLEMMKHLRTQLVNNEPILFVIDSTAALETLDNVGTSQVDKRAEMGNRAKKIYEFFRTRNKLLGDLGVTTILINQIRKKVGASQWEDPDTTPGGQAARFYASQRLSLGRSKSIKETIGRNKDRKTGQNVKFYTKKDKTGPPREATDGKVYYLSTKDHGIGFDKYVGLPELLVDLGVITRLKGNSRYYYKDKMIAHGEEAMMQVLQTDEELRRKLIKRSGINTISKALARIEAQTTNLFPIQHGASDEE